MAPTSGCYSFFWGFSFRDLANENEFRMWHGWKVDHINRVGNHFPDRSFFSLKDRWPRLSVGIRKGEWCKLKPTVDRTEVVFKGLVDVYNVSNRTNTIRGYKFWSKEENGNWIKMDSQLFMENDKGEDRKEAVAYNVTPLTLGPYSGIELRVMAFKKGIQPAKMDVRMQITDVFGKKYRVEVTATS